MKHGTGRVRCSELLRRLRKTICRIARAASRPADAYVRRRISILCRRLVKLCGLALPGGRRAIARGITALAGAALCATPALASLPVPKINLLSPAANTTAAVSSANIDISFNVPMKSSSLTSAHIRIYGSQSGFLSTRGSFSGSQMRSFNPDADFRPGELISVSVTGATSTDDVQTSRATVYSFFAAVQGGAGAFIENGNPMAQIWTVGVETGDLDGDGDIDILLAHDDDGSNYALTSWLNDGGGAFSSKFSSAISSKYPVLGDLDGDGDLDAIAPMTDSYQSPAILLNNGDGSFESSTFGLAGLFRARLGDLDGDGDLDAVLGIDRTTMSLWLNNGDGTFSSSNFSAGSKSIGDIVLGDLDGDGDLDAVVGTYSSTTGPTILLNNGDATFSSIGHASLKSQNIAIGDLDGDGDLDLAIGGSNFTHLWLNDGSASFATSLLPSSAATDLEIGDLDGDGDLDLVLINAGPGSNFILLNNGDADFSSDSFKSFGSNNRAASLADLDGDGDLDMIAANYTYNVDPELWLNGGSAEITSLTPAANAKAAPRDSDIEICFGTAMNTASLTAASIPNNANLIVYGAQTGHITTKATISYASGDTKVVIDPAADFKAGEKISVIVTGATAQSGSLIAPYLSYEFRAAVSGGDAIFQSSSFGQTGAGNWEPAIGDLDGDGDLDAIIALEFPESELWLNQGDGSFVSSGIASDFYHAVALGDLDGDGDLDALMVNNEFRPQKILFNNGDASFAELTFSGPKANDVALGDLDGDGDLDAVFSSESPDANTILLNNGDGTFTSTTFGGVGPGRFITIGDLDGDGDQDVFVTKFHCSELWLNNGDATFSSSCVASGAKNGVAMGDLDCDGDLDLVVTGVISASSELWLNNGDASFATSDLGIQGSNAAIGDVDGDGDLDVITSSSSFNDTPSTLLLNNGNASFSSSSFGIDGEYSNIALGDLDDDGDLDFIQSIRYYHQAIWLNGAPPQVNSLQPDCIVATTASVPLTLSGLALGNVTGATLQLPQTEHLPYHGGGGAVDLAVNSSTATSLLALIPAGSAVMDGSYTLTLLNRDGQSSTTFTIQAPVAITGASCGCPGTTLTYTAEPAAPGTSHFWTVAGGTIISGQSTATLEVEWTEGAAVSVAVARTFPAGCTSHSVLAVSPKTFAVLPDAVSVCTGNSVDIAVLANDSGSGLSLKSVADPANGTAVRSGNTVRYTPDNSFAGLDIFSCVIENADGCLQESSVIVAVGRSLASNLEFLERQKDKQGGVRGLRGVEGLDISPDGKHLYAGGKSDHSLAVFERRATNGTLSYVERQRDGRGGVQGLQFISDVAVSPDGKHVYSTSFKKHAVAVFTRSSSNGSLSFVEWKRQNEMDGGLTITGMKGAHGLAISPDAKNVYVAGKSDNSIAVFTRDANTGALSFIERQKDGADGVDGLKSVQGLALSPDGKHLYAAGAGDKALAVFSRDAGTGALSYIERHKDGRGGVDGLNGAVAVSLSANGSHVYVAGSKDKAVAVFSRNDSSGRLAFVQRLKDSQAGLGGIDGAYDVAVAPDGNQVYVAGESDNALAAFARDACTGELAFIERKKDGQLGVDGLRGTRGIAVSPDSRYVYGSGRRDNGVAAFFRNFKPLALDDNAMYVAPGSSVEIMVLNNDIDPDGHDFSVIGKTDGALGTVSIAPGGKALTYTAGLDAGPDSFSYTVSDGHGGSSSATVTIAVAGNAKQSWTGDDAMRNSAEVLPCEICSLRVGPNPSHGMAVISFELARAVHVRLHVRDLTGRIVATLADGVLTEGPREIPWDGRGEDRGRLVAGCYLIVIEALGADEAARQALPLILLD